MSLSLRCQRRPAVLKPPPPPPPPLTHPSWLARFSCFFATGDPLCLLLAAAGAADPADRGIRSPDCGLNPVSEFHEWTALLLCLGCLCFGHVTSSEGCGQDERDALLKFKADLEDPSSSLSSWVVQRDCCLWSGVVCDNVTSHVTELHLGWESSWDGSVFSGKLNSQLLQLKYLSYLDLSNNHFQGIPIPSFLGSMSSLNHLYLDGAGFGGVIPHQLGNLTNLQQLGLQAARGYVLYGDSLRWLSELLEIIAECASDTLQVLLLSSCQLSGQLTDRIGVFKSLNRLSLGNNSISGSLPMSFGEMTSLYHVNLARNKISGTIPTSFGALAQLEYLDISQNKLQGVIYSEIHFANLRRLACFIVSGNKVVLKAKPDWVPSKLLERLDLESCYVGPGFPHWLQSLQHLKSLDLSNSGISEPIPDWFWSMSSQFYYMNLSHNQIPGRLPHVIAVVNNLSMFDFSSNFLEGPLPTISSYLTFLDLSNNLLSGNLFKFLCFNPSEKRATEFLSLYGNRLTGEIPDCWKTWQSLSSIRLDRNKLSGKIPRSLGYLSSLKSLRLQNNRLSGEIPPSVQNCSRLITVDLGYNGLEGKIPEWIGQSFSRLSILNLGRNKFHGSIPKEICNLQSLQILDLSHNSLSGTLPKCIANLTAMATPNNDTSGLISLFAGASKLFSDTQILARKGQLFNYSTILNYVRSLDLSWNNLSGQIPNQITSLAALQYLNLSHNALSGAIPEDLTAMLSLESLDLSMNQLAGSIPSSLGSLTFLNFLNLSHNNLGGIIPSSTQLQSFDSWSFIGNRELCGPPLKVDCSSNNRVPGLIYGEENDEEYALHWFSGSVVLGFVGGFWGVVALFVLLQRSSNPGSGLEDHIGQKLLILLMRLLK
ncbi:unnamed protein product [Linum tenue]|uniref:Leucine-rich repeat-containing N-terminal plant-type domain-containing protein n=1 Tax=Linum tenue TaxID=586396 RepID=A0AAV0M3U3_9ROSI|nr:unnamed protein product [Linum tenue]